jgi:mannose-6-phosphate isomerase-like protein (cupin superfamily)
MSGGSGLAGIESWQWRLGPTASYDAPAHPAGTRESLWVHRGRLRVRVGENAVTAGAGDAIQFEASRPHRYENAGKAPCEFSMIVLLPRAGR